MRTIPHHLFSIIMISAWTMLLPWHGHADVPVLALDIAEGTGYAVGFLFPDSDIISVNKLRVGTGDTVPELECAIEPVNASLNLLPFEESIDAAAGILYYSDGEDLIARNISCDAPPDEILWRMEISEGSIRTICFDAERNYCFLGIWKDGITKVALLRMCPAPFPPTLVDVIKLDTENGPPLSSAYDSLRGICFIALEGSHSGVQSGELVKVSHQSAFQPLAYLGSAFVPIQGRATISVLEESNQCYIASGYIAYFIDLNDFPQSSS